MDGWGGRVGGREGEEEGGEEGEREGKALRTKGSQDGVANDSLGFNPRVQAR